MAKKPRINVSLTQSNFEIIETISKISGKSKSGTLSELLDSLAPVLNEIYQSFLVIQAEQQKLNDLRDDELQLRLMTRLAKAASKAEKAEKDIRKSFKNVAIFPRV